MPSATTVRPPMRARKSSSAPPVLSLLQALGAWPEIVAYERRHPSASLAAFWTTCPRGMWLVFVLFALRDRPLDAQNAERFRQLHRSASAAYWRSIDAHGLGAVRGPAGADAVRAVVGTIDWFEVLAAPPVWAKAALTVAVAA